MKINLGKLLRVVGRVIVAAPVIIEAVKPVLRKRTKPTPVPAGEQGGLLAAPPRNS